MAEITTTQAFSDGDTVTAAKLNNITGNASIQNEAITNRSPETSVDQANDLLLMYDASATALKKVAVSNIIKAGTASDFPVAGNLSVNGNTTLGDASTDTLTVNATPTFATQANTISGTASTPAISPTGDANTGLFFPAADTIAFAEGGAEAMRIDSSGNVGIGTTSPDAKLEVAVGDNGGINIEQTSANIQGRLAFRDSDGTIAGQIAYDHNDNKLRIFTNEAERLRIDSSGNVGIGNTSPNRKLDVKGSNAGGNFLALSLWNESTNTSDSSTSIDIPVFNGADGLKIKQQTSSSQNYNCSILTQQSTASLILGSGANTERLRIDSSGNLLVGATTANSVLPSATRGYVQINGSNDSALAFTSGGTLGGYIYNSSGEFRIANYSNNYLSFYTNNTERFRVDSSGRVGIGTTSPSTALQVNGTITATSFSGDLSGNSSTTSQRNFSQDIGTTGQGRFSGWYNGNASTGFAVECGVSSGQGYVIAYNRSTSAYGVLNINNASFSTSGVLTTPAGTLGSNGNGARTVTTSTSTPTGGSDGDIVYVV